MKRLLTILMVLMLLFVNVGCGEKGRLQEDNDTNIQQETKDKENMILRMTSSLLLWAQ